MKQLFFICICLLFLTCAHKVSAAEGILAEFTDPQSAQGLDSANMPQETLKVVFYPHKEAVISSELQSTVKIIAKEFGQSFKKDDMLIHLSEDMFAWQRDKAEAIYNQELKTFNVISRLYREKSRSVIELEEARGKLNVAKANVNIANKEFDNCTIKAPYNGRVEKVFINEGEWVEPGAMLLKIVDDSILYARTLILWNHVDAFPLGKTVDIIVNNGLKVSGSVSHISASMDSASQTFEIQIEVHNVDQKLRSGMTGAISLDGSLVHSHEQ